MMPPVNPHIKKIQQFIMKTSFCLEIVCALILIAAILIAFLDVPHEMYNLYLDNGFDLDDFIAKSFELVIGVELLKMFCRHDLDSIVEVLLFAIARQIVIEHLPMQESLLGTIAVAILFAVRKYLFIMKLDNPCAAKKQEKQETLLIHKQIDAAVRKYLGSGSGAENSAAANAFEADDPKTAPADALSAAAEEPKI